MPSFFKKLADRLEAKYKKHMDSPEVDFAHIRDGICIDNDNFITDLCRNPVYNEAWDIETKLKEQGLYTIPEEDEEDINDPVHDSDTDLGESDEDCMDGPVIHAISLSLRLNSSNDQEFVEIISKSPCTDDTTSFEYAVWSWRVFYRSRFSYWYIFKGEECMLVKPFGKEYGNSVAKVFYPMWKRHFGPGIVTSLRNCRAYAEAFGSQGKTQWVKLDRSVFGNAEIMGTLAQEPDWDAIRDMNSRRVTRVLDPNVYIVNWRRGK